MPAALTSKSTRRPQQLRRSTSPVASLTSVRQHQAPRVYPPLQVLPNTPHQGRLYALPRVAKQPGWLVLLLTLQQGATWVTGGLLVTTFVLYGHTVYVDWMVSRATNRLAVLQRGEQQLVTANEVLKNHMAEQATAEETRFQSPQPNSTIFLPSKPPSSEAETVPASPHPALGQGNMLNPLGY